MRKVSPLFPTLVLLVFSCSVARAQSATGTLDFIARVTPTAAHPEPVRQFTFYVLTKSYAEVVKEVEEQNVLPTRDKFIEDLKVSPELKDWLKAHDILDLTMPDLDRLVDADNIIHVPEFLAAYQRSNSGGVTNGIPVPRYHEIDKTENPDRYNKQVQEYRSALKKFIEARPETVGGMELELDAVNPQHKWDQVQAEHKNRVLSVSPKLAQTKYLAGQIDTDLDGKASISGLPPGNYWISTLNLEADAGDVRLSWDVPVTIQPGQTVHLALSNLNAVDKHSANP